MEERWTTNHPTGSGEQPTFQKLSIPGVGHAPGLMSEDQIAPIVEYLSAAAQVSATATTTPTSD